MAILRADARRIPLKDGTVHCVVTSPPYYGLRSYSGLPDSVWSGDPDCGHEWGERVTLHDEREPDSLAGKSRTTDRFYVDESRRFNGNHQKHTDGQFCARCGAWRGQLGLEPRLEMYIAHMVEVFREVRRVMRDDGVVFLNIGDSYYSDPGKGGSGTFNGRNGRGENYARASRERVQPCDTSDKARLDYRRHDSSLFRLCDGCRGVLLSDGISRSDHSPASSQEPLSSESNHAHMESALDHFPSVDFSRLVDHNLNAIPDFAPSQDLAGAPLHASQASTPPESSQQRPKDCHHCANCDACLNVLASASRDARLCARRTVGPSASRSASRAKQDRRTNTDDIGSIGGVSGLHNVDKLFDSDAWRDLTTTSLKPKDLMLVPFRLALALQNDGWWIRSDIIWQKPNPLPESVTDRPTRSHEYVFLLAKAGRYFYDALAIAEAISPKTLTVTTTPYKGDGTESAGGKLNKWMGENGGRYHPQTRNKRDVWTINGQPTPEAHFATFPERLVEPCILAGTSERGCCAECGAPWERETERGGGPGPEDYAGKWLAADRQSASRRLQANAHARRMMGAEHSNPFEAPRSLGWRAGCDCAAGTVPCLVVDPFLGSGTTGRVAERFGRRWVGLELSGEYIEIAKRRTSQMGLMFCDDAEEDGDGERGVGDP